MNGDEDNRRMSGEEQRPPERQGEDAREGAPEPDSPPAPPPATWAGRARSAAGSDEPAEDSGPEDTQEFQLEVELDEELDAGEPVEDEAEQEPGEEAAGEEPDAEAAARDERAAAEEAALAGIRSRAAGKGAAPSAAAPAAPSPQPQPTAQPSAVTAAPEPAEAEEEEEEPPRARTLWARFLAASLVIVISMATATSVSLLLYLTDIAKGLGDDNALADLDDQLAAVDGGDPQTILILGSDERLSEKGIPGRSDTALLLRVDPEKDAIALLSIPRDLKVNVPGVGIDKFNVAYSEGGPKLALRVVRQLTGLEVNHVVNINFTGFADAVNAIDCVYVDVDRRYFIPPEANYAEIDIEAGYQRLCGLKALQYVRYRYDDNDLVRAARQQDFLREARQKVPPSVLIRDRNKLIDIFTDYTTSDISDPVTMLELLKTFAGAASAPVSEVHFPAELGDGTSPYVTASESAIKKAVRQFLGVSGTPGARPAGSADNPAPENEEAKERRRERERKKREQQQDSGPPMIDATASAQEHAGLVAGIQKRNGEPMVDFPIFYPTRLVPGSALTDATRGFPIDGPERDVYHGYKLVVTVPGSAGFSEYYGISGTDWRDPPILENPSETRRIDGREYLLFYDGDRLRLIGWKTGRASYWVSNTLLQTLEEDELISIATSTRRLGS